MFNNLKGASGRFQFKVISLVLQKSLLRGDIDMSLEMAKEFRDNIKMLSEASADINLSIIFMKKNSA